MNKTYCAAPWHGLHINPTGDVKTCCAGNPNILGNLNTENIDDILHSDKMQEIRNTLRTGSMHREYCYNCIQAEKHQDRSERHWHNDISKDFDTTTAESNYHRPVLVDVRWNITCNQSCNYCGELCSSKWAALKGIPTKSQLRPYYDQVHEYLKKYQTHMREVALVGGEPLLLPENEKLLDIVPDDTIITIITNFSVDLTQNKIFEKLSKRRNVGWSLSFDNIGERYEYVRYGGRWEQLEKNIKLLKPLLDNGHWGGIHSVYNLYNATRLNELTDWARLQGLNILWQPLFQPKYLDPMFHSDNILDIVCLEIDKLLSRNDLTDQERNFFEPLRQSYQTRNKTNLWNEFVKYNKRIENDYHPDTKGNFEKLWPEFLMNVP